MEPTTRVAKVINKPNDAPTVRHGTVESVDGDTLQVLIDNTASPITCARACVCVQGDRVVVVGKDAIATVGANYGGGGSGSIATTTNLLKGDNNGNAIAATPTTDYVVPSDLATVATTGDYDDLLDKPTIPSPSSTAPAMDGTASAGSSTDYARADHVHPTDTGRAAASHTHGSITDAGAITSDTSVASGDKLVIADSSDSSKLKRSNISIGSDTTKFLRNDGTWQVPSGGGGGGGSIASTTGLLAGDGAGNAIAADPSALFVLERYVVINGVSTANGGVAENTVTESKAGYYPVAIAGWTSSNRYPNVYGCRLTAQSVGSASIFCGASNFSGSTRTLTVSAVVLWVKVS